AGRLAEEYVAPYAASSILTYAYDPMGRYLEAATCTPQTCGHGGFFYYFAYDLAGNTTRSNYTAGATLSTVYDLAGRPLSLSSSVAGSLVSSAALDARANELSSALGNGVVETRAWDARGRLTSMSATYGSAHHAATAGTGTIYVDGYEQYVLTPDGCMIDDCTQVWDSGDVWAQVGNGGTNYATYGQYDTAASVASNLAWALSGTGLVTATASGSQITLTATSTGSNTNYTINGGCDTDDVPDFGGASFCTGGGGLGGGTDAYDGTLIYSLNGMSYAPNGALLASTDSVNGAYAFTMNDLNQLVSACNPNCTGYAFDRYGNRWNPASGIQFNGLLNRVDGWSYDADGNVLNDGHHSYAYDAENRLIAVDGGATASYVYDAEGRRVHESIGGVVKEYVYGQSGQELTVVDANQNLLAGETYFNGRYLGTQTPGGFSWAHADELGETDLSGPWGEPTNLQNGTSQIHFTGKLFDPETNFSYFGARYYNPALGRFLTPDWSEDPEAVPYANLENPQSLNLYSYVLNNPVTETDPDAHWCLLGFGTTCTSKIKLPVKESGLAGAATADATLSPGLDVSGILDGLKATADSITTGATTLGEGALGVFGGLITLSQPLNPGEDQFMARVNAEIKKNFGGGKADLYKDPQGNIYVKPKDFAGKGEPIGININNVH